MGGAVSPTVTVTRAAEREVVERAVGTRAAGGAPALVHGYGQAEPPAEGKIGRVVGPQDAVNAVIFENELDFRGHGFGCGPRGIGC